ncbi:hypothetical protein [Leifsonia sp. Le1]|uniref:hypothetical protein n=1 Tax=Leifsonia sp. Le1 TaxID=3404918 RepID=UPI003EBDC854
MSDEPRPVSARSGPAATRIAVITRASWLLVMVLTSVFHFLRGAPVDAWIFLGGAVLIALDALGWLHIPVRALPDGQTLSRRVIAFSLIGVAALTFAFAPLYGGADTALVVGLGVLLLPVVWADRPRASGAADAGGRPQSQDAAPEARAAIRRAAIAWSAVIVAGCAWEIAAFFLGRSSPAAETAFPALSDLVDPAVAWPPARAALVVLWLAGGYALLRRGQR